MQKQFLNSRRCIRLAAALFLAALLVLPAGRALGASKKKVLFIGDSITWGYISSGKRAEETIPEIVKKETDVNGDGSFLSNRFGAFEESSPVYYTRLESDRANVLSMALYWHGKYDLKGTRQPEILSSWQDAYHGASFVTGGNRYASFVWQASEKPQGLLLPKDDSSLAEWRYNLSGRILGVGRENYDEVLCHRERMFPGGFVTSGSTLASRVQYSSD